MRQPIRLGALAALLTCVGTVARSQAPAPPTPIEQLWARGSSFGDTRAQLLRKLGAPTRTHVDTFRNPHRQELDSIVTLEFSELRFSVRTAGDREFLQLVRFERDQYEVVQGLVIGRSSEAEIRRRYGAPDVSDTRPDSLMLRYVASGRDEAEEYVVFTFVRGALRRVAWEFYVD